MTDKDKKGSGFPGSSGENDLLAEFDAWDKNLDSLFGGEDEVTAASQIGADNEPKSFDEMFRAANDDAGAEDVFESSLDFLDDQESFDDLLAWLDDVENREGLLVTEIAITRSGTTGRVNATIRIAQG